MSLTQSRKPSTQPGPVTFAWDDFSGGLNADHAAYPLALNDNELVDILNYRYVRKGMKIKLRSRPGLVLYNTAGVAGGAINDIFFFMDSSLTEHRCVVADSDLKYINGSGSFTKIGDLSSTRGRMCHFNNKLIIADSGVLKFYDGTSFGPLIDLGTVDIIDSLSGSYTTARDTNYDLYNLSKVRAAQRLTTQDWGTETKTLSSVTFRLKKTGAPTGNITSVIYASDGTTVVETSSTTLDITTLTTSYVDYSFTFSGTIAANTVYYFTVLYSGGDSGKYLSVKANAYIGMNGDVYFYVSSWTSATPYDLYLKITVTATAPSASFAISKQNRIYCNDILHPNWFRYCAVNDPNDWSTSDNAGYIIFDAHTYLLGAAVFYDDIYIFAGNPSAIYKLTGNSPDEYMVKLMWNDLTSYSNDVIEDVGSDLMFKDPKGIYSLRTMEKYGDIEKGIVSKDTVNNTYITPYTSQIAGKLNSDNYLLLTTADNYLVAYDQELGIWTRWQMELGTGVTPTAFGLNFNGDAVLGDSAGNLYYFSKAAVADNGTAFSLLAKPAWTDFGTLLEKDARFADSVMISANQETYDLELYINFNNTTPIKTINTVSLSQNGAYETPGCGHLTEVNFNFKQIMPKLTNISSATGSHWLDRIVIEANILQRY